MSLIKKSYYRLASLVPFSLLKNGRAGNLLLPYHHLVTDEKRKHIQWLFNFKNKRQFRKDLDYLLSHFRAVHPEELILASRTGQRIKAGGFLLSFDDGLSEVHEQIAPILQEKGVSGIFFLNPAFLDNREMFYRSKLSLVLDSMESRPPSLAVKEKIGQLLGIKASGREEYKSAILGINYLNRQLADQLGDLLEISFENYLKQVKPYLLTEQVRELIGKGFYFGAHSMDHPNYRLISLKEQISQTRKSCKFLRETFGLSYTTFSFPHEDAGVGQTFFDELAKTGDPRVDLFFGTQNQKSETHNRVYHRFNAERPEYPIEGLVKGVLLYSFKKQTVIREA